MTIPTIGATFSQGFSPLGRFMAWWHTAVLTETAVSISEHKKNPMATVAAFTWVPAKAYEELMDLGKDLELGRLADARLADGQKPLRVSFDAL